MSSSEENYSEDDYEEYDDEFEDDEESDAENENMPWRRCSVVLELWHI